MVSVKLTDYMSEDFDNFYKLVTDSEVMKHVDGVLDEFSARRIFKSFVEEPTIMAWAIKSQDDESYLGHAALVYNKPEDAYECIIYVASTNWRQSVATKAWSKIVEFVIMNKLNVKKIFGTIDPENEASIKLCEKIGFEFREKNMDEKGSYYIYEYIMH